MAVCQMKMIGRTRTGKKLKSLDELTPCEGMHDVVVTVATLGSETTSEFGTKTVDNHGIIVALASYVSL